MLDAVKSLIPSSAKQAIKGRFEAVYRSRLFGDLAPLVPAVDDMFEGPQGLGIVNGLKVFKANGEEFLNIYKEVCSLRPDEKMLDVGCGIGRKTLPLTRYLSRRGTYDGIDITPKGIIWCDERITPRFPNFKFQQIDVYNQHYNPTGTHLPSAYKFPFEDNAFDFVMLGSVFTHMLPDDMLNYLGEVHRVLKKGGRCLITYFLLNEESLSLMGSKASTLNFKYSGDRYRTTSEPLPELAIALDEEWVRQRYKDVGLTITRIDYGSWCARPTYLSYQDLVLAVRQ